MLSVAAFAETSPVEFRGIFVLGNKQQFSLAAGNKWAWVTIGDSFFGYTVTRFEAEEKVLVLTKGAAEIKIGLAGARVTDFKPPLVVAAIPPVSTDEVLANLLSRADGARVQLTLTTPETPIAFEGNMGRGLTVLPDGQLQLQIAFDGSEDEKRPHGSGVERPIGSTASIKMSPQLIRIEPDLPPE